MNRYGGFILALMSCTLSVSVITAQTGPEAGSSSQTLRSVVGGQIVVCVLYFDNNSGDKSLDGLQKGLADMMITDLSQEDSIQVVERGKLQQLIDELKLQNTAYFDPKTAQSLGQGLGADYALTGSFLAVESDLRVDARLIKISTSRVVNSAQVDGPRKQLFRLQRELATRLLEKLRPNESPKSPIVELQSVESLAEYSKGLDLFDRGDYGTAANTFAAVRDAEPNFALADIRYREAYERLRAFTGRFNVEQDRKKEEALQAYLAEEKVFLERARTAIEGSDPKGRLYYRTLIREYFLKRLEHAVAVANKRWVEPRQRPGSPAVDGETFATDADKGVWDVTFKNRIAHHGGGTGCRQINRGLESYHQLPEASSRQDYLKQVKTIVAQCFEAFAALWNDPDAKLLYDDKYGFNYKPKSENYSTFETDNCTYGCRRKGDIAKEKYDVAVFLLEGRIPLMGHDCDVWPTPVAIDPRYKSLALQLFSEAFVRLVSDQKTRDCPEVRRVVSSYTKLLIEQNRKLEAVDKWQHYLDSCPDIQSSESKRIQKDMLELLGQGSSSAN